MIELVAVGEAVQPRRLDALGLELTRIFKIPCRVRTGVIDPAPARDDTRQQYRSTRILDSLRLLNLPNRTRVLGVAAVDLFVPIFTFVFGEAELDRSEEHTSELQ